MEISTRERRRLRKIYLDAAEILLKIPSPVYDDGCCLMIERATENGWQGDENLPEALIAHWIKPETTHWNAYWMIEAEDRCYNLSRVAPRVIVERRVAALLFMAEIVMTEEWWQENA